MDLRYLANSFLAPLLSVLLPLSSPSVLSLPALQVSVTLATSSPSLQRPSSPSLIPSPPPRSMSPPTSRHSSPTAPPPRFSCLLQTQQPINMLPTSWPKVLCHERLTLKRTAICFIIMIVVSPNVWMNVECLSDVYMTSSECTYIFYCKVLLYMFLPKPNK